jgi:GMP reductase
MFVCLFHLHPHFIIIIMLTDIVLIDVIAREYVFRNSEQKWHGVPIIAANMDTVGTFEMATALAAHKIITAVHKHYSVAQWTEFATAQPSVLPYLAVSAGTGEEDFKKLGEILKLIKGVNMICLDVANGYSEFFVTFVRFVSSFILSSAFLFKTIANIVE